MQRAATIGRAADTTFAQPDIKPLHGSGPMAEVVHFRKGRQMNIRLLAALMAAAVLGACGFDATPQSSGTAGASSSAASAPSAPAGQKDEPKAKPEKISEGEKKAD